MTKDSGEEEKNNKTIEKQEDDTMFLWEGVSLFDTEKSTLKHENIPTATKDMDLIIKDNATISKIKKLQENVKRQINDNVGNKTPEVTTVNQETDQVNEHAKLMERQVDVNKGNTKKTGA